MKEHGGFPPVAVVGAGYWGRNLVRNYREIGALRLVCDMNEALLSGPRGQGIETTLALSDVLTHPEVRGVVIATPAETHFRTAREALLAGKHVFVEKPLVLVESQAEELIALAAERKLTLMVGHLLQYHPVFVKLLDVARKGELGRINYVYSHRLNLGKIRREENALWSFAPHDISMILSLAGEEPEHVMATGGNYLHSKIADVTTTHLEFASGMRAHIFVSWLHPFKDQKLVVVGDRRMAVFDDTLPWGEKLALYAHTITWENNVPVPGKAAPEYVPVPQVEPLREECEHFLRCIAEGAPPRTDGREGLRVLRVLNASQRSLDRNGEKVACAGASPEKAQAASPPPAFFAHETAVIDQGVEVGEGTKIWHFSHVLSGSKVGKNVSVGQNVVIGPDVIVGSGCKIQNNVSVYKGVTLEDDVFCGPSMVFTNVHNPRAHIRRMHEIRKTIVRKGATLGANCTIVCGTEIGRYAFVGAGAVVTRSVSDHALVAGNPARRIGWMCACGTRLGKGLACPACGQTYDEAEGALAPLHCRCEA